MDKVAGYLMENYYRKYDYFKEHPEMMPSKEILIKALDINKDKVVTVKQDGKVLGAAVFLTLTDETFSNMDAVDVTDIDVLIKLLEEKGRNIHFILVAGEGSRVLRAGIHIICETMNPKTISWWNPDMSKLHKYNMN